MMDETSGLKPDTSSSPTGQSQPEVNSLRELLDLASGRAFHLQQSKEDSGLAEHIPFPYLALVGQKEMKLALLLAVINPAIGGVLLVGPRGTGKTTAVRSLLDLLPEVQRSACYYGCTPEDVENGGIDAVCPDCAKKYAEGQPLTHADQVHLVELPLNARLDDVIGGVDDRILAHERMRLKRGILAQADLNLLYIDEVNLLSNEIIDSILDAAAQGSYTVRRGPISATYKSRFTLIGSMNPEEGSLRPQIMDRFGLRIVVRGLKDPEERLEAYQRVRAYQSSPHSVVRQYAAETASARQEIGLARSLLPEVKIPKNIADLGIQLIQHLKIDSLRAEISLFEAARAHAAARNSLTVNRQDIQIVAHMALSLRHSNFISQFLEDRRRDEEQLDHILNQMTGDA
jgi:magnesium chelatase subunit I